MPSAVHKTLAETEFRLFRVITKCTQCDLTGRHGFWSLPSILSQKLHALLVSMRSER